MWVQLIGTVWRRLPPLIRRRVSLWGQARFAVTVAAMIFDDEGQILLFEHVFRADHGWGVPGGFVSRGEQPIDALRRELHEEANIELDNIQLLFTRSLRIIRQVEIYYRARAIGEPKPCSFEIKSTAWFPLNALPSDLSKDQRRLIERAVELDEKCH